MSLQVAGSLARDFIYPIISKHVKLPNHSYYALVDNSANHSQSVLCESFGQTKTNHYVQQLKWIETGLIVAYVFYIIVFHIWNILFSLIKHMLTILEIYYRRKSRIKFQR